MKDLLNSEHIDEMQKMNVFREFVLNFTKSYEFDDIFISKNTEWAVLHFSPLYNMTFDSKFICVNKNSGMKNCNWTKQFEINEIKEVVNFLASELQRYPIK
jgi:hypothetical protein